MKTLKVVDGDFVFDEAGNLVMVEGDEEIAQGALMNLSIRKGEFELDENIGLDTSFMQNKLVQDEEISDSVLEALQVLTDQNIIEGAENIMISRQGRSSTIDLDLVKTDGLNISLEGVDLSGSE
ncbi:DUF2634 domain-containing protein [Rummeliibacillus sp. TYF-LIM-RU47]|uniref:DUF2634 domain-containing protein n=1 Tax=Rummeliibacillus sp. TYF-LIM-RU47 TaxID=2608406 RepID=UPI00123A75C6|nr:DUF2634 domain-containing protein [Rummeliibacillus sp. TYF-LIM-RU47]